MRIFFQQKIRTIKGPRPAGSVARGLLVTACLVLLADHAWGAPKAEKSPEPPPPEVTWWMETENAQMRGYSDGTRVMQDGDSVEVREAVRPATLTTADGARYQATEEGRVILLESAGNASRRSAVATTSRPALTPGDRDAAFAVRPVPQNTPVVGANAKVEESDVLSSDVTGWGRQTVELLLKVFAIILLLRLVFFWVDLSYSHASVIRFSLAFVVIGEIAVRFLSTALWAG